MAQREWYEASEAQPAQAEVISREDRLVSHAAEYRNHPKLSRTQHEPPNTKSRAALQTAQIKEVLDKSIMPAVENHTTLQQQLYNMEYGVWSM